MFLHGKSQLKLAKPYPNDHGGRRRPTAAMVPHSQQRRVRQSANILGDCFMRRVGNHGGLCWPFRSRRVGRRCCVVVSVFLLGKLASENAPTNHGGRLPSRHLGSLHAELVASLRPPSR